MKKRHLLPLAALLLFPLGAVAQEAQEEAPTWWAVFTDHVPPSGVAKYEEAGAALAEMIKANATPDLTYYTLSGSETGYLYAIPMTGLAQFMELNASWEAMMERAGREDFMTAMNSANAVVDHSSLTFYVQRNDLSYAPESPRLTDEESKIRHYDWIYAFPGKEAAMEEIFHAWIDLYQSNGVDSGWTVYQAVSGDDLPMYVVSTPAASVADYFANGDRIDEALGDADDALWMKTLAVTRSFHHNNANFRPELSLVPDEE
ncbi:MAG: hypothetical protein ACE5HF_11435 [Gemmatimonadota bacterium]